MTPTRRRPGAPARREQLLDACAAIADTEGFHAVTIERVATACGVTRTVVYQQLGGLDGLLGALVGRATERPAATIAAIADEAGPPTMRAAMARVLAAVDADPATWRMFLVTPGAGPPALADNLARGRALIRHHNEAAIRRRAEDASGDPELLARMVQAMADELVRLRLADPSVYTSDRTLAMADELGRTFLGTSRRG